METLYLSRSESGSDPFAIDRHTRKVIGTDKQNPTAMYALLQAEKYGWTWIKCEQEANALGDLACALGEPVAAPGRPLIARLTPQSVKEARTNTTSSKYGFGTFPPHTDFAHWPEPPRWLLFRLASEASKTPTLLFDSVNLRLDEKFGAHWRRAVWRVDRVCRRFLCSMDFSVDDRKAIRWDPEVMRPHGPLASAIATDLAREINATAYIEAEKLFWTCHDSALLVDNWRMLHARPTVADDDRHRVLERIAIRHTYE